MERQRAAAVECSPLRQSTMAQATGSSHSRSASFFSFRKTHSHSISDPLVHPSPSMSLPASGNDIKTYDQPLPSLPPPQHESSHPPSRQPSTNTSQLHPEIRSLVQLNVAHAYKIYYSGPLVRRIERLPDGQKATKDEGWTDIWAQLGGTTLSIWDMKQVQEASKEGREVPPTYINMTDAFIKVLGAVTEPETPTTPAKRYTDILAVNTAGSNLIFFSCPSREALVAWIAALRLSSWEKSRLEEIYTAHLLRLTQQARDIPSPLARGKMEGWVRIRIAGQTDWKRLWMLVQAGTDGERPTSGAFDSSSGVLRKRRVSNLFSRDRSPGPAKPVVAFYLSQKPKDKKRPLLTLQDVTQAFAVYPERPELINRSTLIKIEGQFANEELAREMINREGWILVMPDLEGGNNQVGEMLRWIIALHDAFGLYGRPQGWTWDPRDRGSLMFGYPVGPQKESLFLGRETAETLDPRDDRTSAIRSNLQKLLFNKMQNAGMRAASPEQSSPQPLQQQSPTQQEQPIQQQQLQLQQVPEQSNANAVFSPQLPPLSFGDLGFQQRTPLPPVAEVSVTTTPEMPATSLDGPPITVAQPYAGAVLPPTIRSVTASQTHQKQPSINSQAPASDAASSPQPQPSSPVSPKGKAREDSISRGSLPSPRQRGQPITFSASQTSDDRPPSRSSMLTSPHSVVEKVSPSESAFTVSKNRAVDNMSILSSPYSLGSIRRELPPMSPPPDRALPTEPSSDVQALFNEAGALYYVNTIEGDSSKQQPANRIPTTISEQDDSSSSESDQHPAVANLSSPATSPPPASVAPSSPKISEISKPVPVRQNTPTAFAGVNRKSPTVRSGSGRKPSGARELGTGRSYNNGSLSSSPKPLAKEDLDSDNSMDVSQLPSRAKKVPDDDSNLDVLAALSYLDVNGEPPSRPVGKSVEPLKIRSPERSTPSSLPESSSAATVPIPTVNEPMQDTQYRSSFAPSKQAAERKAKVQAQQVAHHAAVHKPGRLNGRRKSKIGGAWGESSEEEEEDDDDDDDDDDDEADSDDDRPSSNKPYRPPSGNASSNTSSKPPQSQNPSVYHGDAVPEHSGHSGMRGPRTLPQLPSGPPHGDERPPQPRRMFSEQHLDPNRRPLHEVPPMRSQSDFPQPGPSQKTLWSQVLEPGRVPGQFPDNHHARDTFIQLEPASETMTKAFTPQGLLSAGLQDKQDRSAKRQEELAREMGASLINVPNKPPPPQTGLLGAITAHERERKREGGMGAALTEREREKRLAEERQRRFDEQQRQQLEQMQHGGSMYGQYPGYNPMMNVNPMMMGMMPVNPMMTGMAPMMTGGMAPMMTGYPGMMPGLNPQQMYAAQHAAAHAYQQAMMTFSAAGSHVGGGENGNGAQPMAPNMTGSMSFMGGYDPRLSMMGMGMMGPQMGPQMAPQMGMPLGMQMTGMSTFDPRFSVNGGNTGGGPANDMGLQPPNAFGGQNLASRSNSPARRESPATRPPELQGETKNSRPTSPKP